MPSVNYSLSASGVVLFGPLNNPGADGQHTRLPIVFRFRGTAVALRAYSQYVGTNSGATTYQIDNGPVTEFSNSAFPGSGGVTLATGLTDTWHDVRIIPQNGDNNAFFMLAQV